LSSTQSREPSYRGFLSSAFRLNVSTVRGIRWVVILVTKTAQVEQKSGRVEGPAVIVPHCRHVHHLVVGSSRTSIHRDWSRANAHTDARTHFMVECDFSTSTLTYTVEAHREQAIDRNRSEANLQGECSYIRAEEEEKIQCRSITCSQ
jgi:hypothetical protein